MVAARRVARAWHRRKARERAARDIDIAGVETGAALRQGEGDQLGVAAGQIAAARTRHDDAGRRGVGRRVGVGLRVVADRDPVVALHHLAGHSTSGATEGVQVLVARVVAELARRHTNGGRAGAVGRRREGGGIDLVARACGARGGHRCEVRERAARDGDVGLIEIGAGLGQRKADGLAAGERAAAQSLDFDGGRRGVTLRCEIEVTVVAAAHAVVLHGTGLGAARARDRAFDLCVFVSAQIGCRDLNAVRAVGSGGAREGFAVDVQPDGVASGVFARDFARDRNAARVLGSAQDVVGGHRIDRQRCFGERVASFERVVLRGGGLVASGAGDAGFDFGVGVGLEVGHGHGHAVAAVCCHRGGVGFAVEHNRHPITC